MTADEWMARFAEALDTDAPSPEEVEALLSLAGTAAHASERVAAPIACYLIGRTGVTLAQAAEIAAAIGPA